MKKQGAKSIDKLISPYRVTSGKGFRLKNFDPGDTQGIKSEAKSEAKALLQRGVEWLSEQQDVLYAQDRWAVLMVFQAMDAAGKDGTIKHVMSGVNPQGCQVYLFQAALQRGTRPRLPLALPACTPRSAAGSAYSTAPTTKKCWWCESTRNYSLASSCPPS